MMSIWVGTEPENLGAARVAVDASRPAAALQYRKFVPDPCAQMEAGKRTLSDDYRAGIASACSCRMAASTMV